MKRMDDPTAVQLAAKPAAKRVLPNIQAASRNTGVSFGYLMAQAGKESAFETEAGSRASSAAGLFQFTRNTWLHLIKTHGSDHGLADLADQIQRTPKGDYVIHDAEARQKILDLRRDPQISALMAGEYAKDNKSLLEKKLGRTVDSTDLYMAHFLGPGGAAKVLKAKDQDPTQTAADLLPQAARKNPSVFYDSNHSARSVAAVYDRVHHSIDRPMQVYAKIDPDGQTTGIGDGKGGERLQGKKTRSPDQPWPFETGQWPPAPIPTGQESAKAETRKAAEPEQQVAYTEVSQSADQISAPMPPVTGATLSQAATPLGKLLKSLFG
ncbi:transglycosylase SLT domain-containing protein [Telmatospirillum siberiense]|uniref:Transglycosylase SLT domain-containing protein n=1 Tax=Telmatospirillum siberiense TaxID=382514 RepID=A0A2N3PNP6_9PROT|nr:transglycosylase SLT domain-containing protein [Telmatospirillum siberiense]PKU22033.1 hypothetical protein CWS72_23795 [Telmatospirillum siberiense]